MKNLILKLAVIGAALIGDAAAAAVTSDSLYMASTIRQQAIANTAYTPAQIPGDLVAYEGR